MTYKVGEFFWYILVQCHVLGEAAVVRTIDHLIDESEVKSVDEFHTDLYLIALATRAETDALREVPRLVGVDLSILLHEVAGIGLTGVLLHQPGVVGILRRAGRQHHHHTGNH